MRILGNEGDRIITYWAIQHYNDPATTGRGYEGWQFNNTDLYPSEIQRGISDCWQEIGISGYLNLDLAKEAIEVLRTKKFNMRTGCYEWKDKLVFDEKPLRIVRVVTSLSIHPEFAQGQ